KKLLLSVVFIGLAAPLGGCESVDSAMHDVRERFSNMEWKMPEITSRDEAGTYVDEERMANPSARTAGEETAAPATPEARTENPEEIAATHDAAAPEPVRIPAEA